MNNGKDLKLLAIILVISSMLAIASCSKNDELKPKPAITTQSDSIAEETPILAEIAYKNKFYRIVAENINSSNISSLAYAIYDMDDNGIPELIIDNGYKTSTMENGVEFYTYSETDGIAFIGSSYDGWTNTFYDEKPGDGKINIVFTGKEKIQVNEYSISNNELTVTTVVDMRDYTDDDRVWLDSLKGKMEFIHYESETSATEFITEEPTSSLYDYYNSQIVLNGRFDSVEELTEYYLNYWNENNDGTTPIETINSVDGYKDKEICSAAIVKYLTDKQKSVNDFRKDLLYMSITLFHPIEGVGFSEKELEGSRNMRKLFGESCRIWGLIKSLPHLLNDWIMIDAVKTSKKVIDVAGHYVTKEIVQLAHDVYGNYDPVYEYFGVVNTTGSTHVTDSTETKWIYENFGI